jgi:predicted MFS family arabinose efflux permease
LEISVHESPGFLDATSRRGRAFVPSLVFVSLLVSTVSSLGAPLVPTLATTYGVSEGSAQWSLTITFVVGTVATPVIGRLGDGPHRRLVLLGTLAALVLGNVLAALPASFALLLAGRGLQGFGLSLIPLTMSIARDHLDPGQARSALATLSVTAVVGVGLGYPLTGLIAEHASFHAAFWGAAGLGAVAMVVAAMIVPPSTHQSGGSFDLIGTALLALALTGLLLSLSEGNEWGWTSALLWCILPASIVLLAVWAGYEARIPSPLVNLRLMRHRTVLAANVTSTLAGVSLYVAMAILIRYVQTPDSVSYGLNASVLIAGCVLVPMSVLSFSSSKLVTFLGRWVRADQLLPVGVVALGASLVIFALFRSQLWQCFLVMGVAGIGVGSIFAVVPRLVAGSVPAEETSSALALTQVLRTVGFSIGSALSATILTAHTAPGELFPSNHGYTVAAAVGAILTVITAVISWLLRVPTSTPAGRADADDELRIDESVDSATAGVLIFENDKRR